MGSYRDVCPICLQEETEQQAPRIRGIGSEGFVWFRCINCKDYEIPYDLFHDDFLKRAGCLTKEQRKAVSRKMKAKSLEFNGMSLKFFDDIDVADIFKI